MPRHCGLPADLDEILDDRRPSYPDLRDDDTAAPKLAILPIWNRLSMPIRVPMMYDRKTCACRGGCDVAP